MMSEIKNRTEVFIYKMNWLHETNFNNIKEPWKSPLGSELFYFKNERALQGGQDQMTKNENEDKTSRVCS